MNNIMIDIETLGTKPGCIILNIGAIKFDLDMNKVSTDFFEAAINIDNSIEQGLKWDKDTFMWWLNQPREARETIMKHSGNGLKAVLIQLSNYIKEIPDAKVWGNSARFDLGILEAAYTACKMKIPWKYYNERDVRTLVAFKPEIKENMPFDGIKHSPLADCLHQIKYCCKIWKTLRL